MARLRRAALARGAVSVGWRSVGVVRGEGVAAPLGPTWIGNGREAVQQLRGFPGLGRAAGGGPRSRPAGMATVIGRARSHAL